MNSQDQQDQLQNEELNKTVNKGIWLFAGLHLLCCGIPLLLLAGVSFSFVWPTWPVIGSVLMVLGIVGFIWYMKRGCATCPRNEGRNCSLHKH
jgi:FtsH-binding integral membrane protein